MIDKSTLKLILLAAILLMLIITLVVSYSKYKFVQQSIVTQGIAIEIVYTSSLGAGQNAQGDISHNDRDQSSQSMKVRFNTNDGQQGETFMSITSDMQIGSEIALRYLPGDPSKAIRDNFLQIWIQTFLFGFITSFLLIVYFVLK